MSGRTLVVSQRLCLSLVCVLGTSAPALAVTLWSDDAEGGAAGVIDHTTGGYSLVQSEAAGQGSYAFHLANPGFADNWFEINQTVAPQADSKLFFLSRLGYATSAQIAKVQISSNAGASWSAPIFSQAGTGGPGEGAFGIKTVDLAPYAGQNLRYRFYYDFTGGSAFTQTDVDVGWLIDDIQIGSSYEKTAYSIGNPSAKAQLYLELINRSRADALAEAARLAATTDADVLSAYSSFGIDTADIPAQYSWGVANGCLDRFAQPLSFSATLTAAAQAHTQDMFDNQFQGHVSSSNPPAPLQPGDTIGDRAAAFGYSYTALGENVYSNSESVEYGHAGFEVDWGNLNNSSDPCYNPAFVSQGMQNPAGHRENLHEDVYKEIGIGVIDGTNGSVGPQLVTQDLGTAGNAAFVTGVVFQDLNGNNFYDLGEGRSGVRIDVDGSAFYAVSSASGGYSVPVVADGVYNVSFTGGGFATHMTSATVVGGRNVKVDYLATAAVTYAADFTENGAVTSADLVNWKSGFGTLSGAMHTQGDADADGDVDGADFMVWQRQLGSGAATPTAAAAPEPCSAALGLVALMVGSVGLRGRVAARR
jgi:hypothetical protein